MFNHRTVLSCLVAVLPLLVACSAEPASTPTSVSAIAAATPASLPSSEPAPSPGPAHAVGATEQSSPDQGPAPTESVGTFPISTPSIQASDSSSRPTGAASPAVDPTEAPNTENPHDKATIQRMVHEYWGYFNAYDPDRALAMLEPHYRAAEDPLIRKDIGRMKLFRVKLEVSVEKPPARNADGDYETYLTLKTPVDSRRLLMVFRQIGEQWWIAFSGEVD